MFIAIFLYGKYLVAVMTQHKAGIPAGKRAFFK
jgi:hypothetical protein